MKTSTYLNIGCGKVKLPGFVNIDREPGGDIQCDVTKGLPYADNTVDGIYSEHFIEHLSQPEIIAFLRECRRVLKSGARVRVATPDLDELVRQYAEQDWRSPWLDEYGYQWIQNRAEYLNVSLREWGHAWVVNEEELGRLGLLAGLSLPLRCALGESQDARLCKLETRKESTLILEFSKHEDYVPAEPLVSIIIPAYRPDFLDACLESAISQAYRKLEILVLDDSPGYEVEKITQRFAELDARITYVRNSPPLGEPDNLTKGIRLAQGDFIKPLYDDDILEPDAVKLLMGAFHAVPDARLAAGQRSPIDAAQLLGEAMLGPPLAVSSGRLRGTEVIGQILSRGSNNLGEPTCMMFRRKDALGIAERNVMTLFGRLCYGAGDVALALHLLSRGDLAYVAQPIAQFRVHSGQTQRQDGFREPALLTWSYLRKQASRLGLPVAGQGLKAQDTSSTNRPRLIKSPEGHGLRAHDNQGHGRQQEGGHGEVPGAQFGRNSIYLYQIAYSDETWNSVPASLLPLDNRANERPDWAEYWPIRRFLKTEVLDENAFYGFLSPRFTHKLKTTPEALLQFVASVADNVDVAAFSPYFDFQTVFRNVFEQGEYVHPGLMDLSSRVLKEAFPGVDLREVVNTSLDGIFCNYFAAKPRFWRAWLALCERVFAMAEFHDHPCAAALNRGYSHRDHPVAAKVFIIERMASLLLATSHQFTVEKFPTPTLSGGIFAKLPYVLLVNLDGLKSQALQGHPLLLNAFCQIQREILHSEAAINVRDWTLANHLALGVDHAPSRGYEHWGSDASHSPPGQEKIGLGWLLKRLLSRR